MRDLGTPDRDASPTVVPDGALNNGICFLVAIWQGFRSAIVWTCVGMALGPAYLDVIPRWMAESIGYAPSVAGVLGLIAAAAAVGDRPVLRLVVGSGVLFGVISGALLYAHPRVLGTFAVIIAGINLGL